MGWPIRSVTPKAGHRCRYEAFHGLPAYSATERPVGVPQNGDAGGGKAIDSEGDFFWDIYGKELMTTCSQCNIFGINFPVSRMPPPFVAIDIYEK